MVVTSDNYAMNSYTKSICLLAVLLLGACGHDAKRDNPLDPALTPPVELEVALNDTLGTATLTWTPYSGAQPFAEYWVLRKQPGLESVDTLSVIIDAAITTYTDTSLGLTASYSYRVSTVNASGLEAQSGPAEVPPRSPPPIEIRELTFDSNTASATLTWTRYAGTDFGAYRVIRASGLETEAIAETESRGDTTFTDADLRGNTEYTYHVVVLTKGGESISNPAATGMFHRLVDSWPIDVGDGGYIRLYRQGADLVALVSEPQRIRHITLDSDGIVDEQVLLEDRWLDIAPFAVGWTMDPDGTRYLGFVRRETDGDTHTAMLLAFDNQGQPLYQTEHATPPLDLHDFADQNPEFDVDGFRTIGVSRANAFDNLIVSSNDRELLAEDFSSANLDDWTSDCGPVTAAEANVEEGEVVVEPIRSIRRVLQTDGNNLVLEVDLTPSGRSVWAFFSIDGCEGFDFAQGLNVGASSQILWLVAGVQDARGEVLGSTQVQQAFPRVPGLAYKLRLGLEDGVARATVTSPMVWSLSLESDDPLGVPGLVALEDYHVFAFLGGAYGIPGRFNFTTPRLPLEGNASEVRIWETEDGQRLGVCLPELHQISIGETGFFDAANISWPFRGPPEIAIGALVGQGAGEFVFPLSMDRSPDGRYYVLDAGNSRIQSFDEVGAYITQWGERGSSDTGFNFGAGNAAVDFVGSIAVDDDGFIYVADVGNKRIQKFTP